jgi:hypothetical protein
VDELKDSGIFLAVTEGFYGGLDVWFGYWCHVTFVSLRV